MMMMTHRRTRHAFTVDVEDWYQGLADISIADESEMEPRVVEETEAILDLCREARVQGTFFVVGDVARRFPGLVEQIVEEGHEIGLHHFHHVHVSRQDPTEFRAGVIQGRDLLERLSGTKVKGFRAPYFSLDEGSAWAINILRDTGFRYDSSVQRTFRFFYGLPAVPATPYHPDPNDLLRDGGPPGFLEIPMSTFPLGSTGYRVPFSGGFYMRALPFPFIKHCYSRFARSGDPVVSYFHPYEFDPAVPIIETTIKERLVHYHNVKGNADRIRWLFNHHPFTTMEEVFAQ